MTTSNPNGQNPETKRPHWSTIVFLLGIIGSAFGNIAAIPTIFIASILAMVTGIFWGLTEVGMSRIQQIILIVAFFLVAGIGFLTGFLLNNSAPAVEQAPAVQQAPAILLNSSYYVDLFEELTDWQTIYEVEAIGTFGRLGQLDESAVSTPYPGLEHGIGYELQTSPAMRAYTVDFGQVLSSVEILSADVFVPDNGNIYYNWVAIQALGPDGTALSGASLQLGEWTRLTLDLRQQFDTDGLPLSQQDIRIEIVYWLTGENEVGDVIVGLDNVIALQNTGTLSIHEQRGDNTILFDFENRNIDNWVTGTSRDELDEISVVSDPTHRGNGALQLTTPLIDVGSVTVAKTTIPALQANGIWVAQVYYDGPESINLWSNMFSYVGDDHSFADANPTVRLQPGQWTTLLWDTRDLDWLEGDAMVGIQIGTTGDEFSGSLYIDDVYIFQQ